jgi:hypothetical protein
MTNPCGWLWDMNTMKKMFCVPHTIHPAWYPIGNWSMVKFCQNFYFSNLKNEMILESFNC